MSRVRVIRAARRDLSAARKYYEGERRGLGDDFLAEFEHATTLIVRYPRVGNEVRPNIRRVLLRRFPYSVLYELTEDEIVVVAVMHHRQKPDVWVERLTESGEAPPS